MMYWGVVSACTLGLLFIAALLLRRAHCRHCGAPTYFRRGYCSTCRLIAISYGGLNSGDTPRGGTIPQEPAHWTAAGSGTTRHESLEGGGFGVPLFLMSFGTLVAIVILFFGDDISRKFGAAAPTAQKAPTPAATKDVVFAHRRKRLYYPQRCGEAGGRIPVKDKITFTGDQEAVRAGYKESATCP